MSRNDEAMDDANGDSVEKVKKRIRDRSKMVAQTKDMLVEKVKKRFRDRSKTVAQTKDMLSKQVVQSKETLSKQAVKIAKQAEEHERFITKVTHFCDVLGF